MEIIRLYYLQGRAYFEMERNFKKIAAYYEKTENVIFKSFTQFLEVKCNIPKSKRPNVTHAIAAFKFLDEFRSLLWTVIPKMFV